jgi:hypothetical protein
MSIQRAFVAMLALAALTVGCSVDPTATEEYQELEQQLAATSQQLDAVSTKLTIVTAERDTLAEPVSVPRAEIAEAIDLDAFAAASGSGDADQIRAFYTDDAVMMPFGHILSTLNSHPMPEYWDVAGPDMDREAGQHDGAIFEFLEANRIGNMVVTMGQWTFPEELFPDLADTVIKTADIWHLRDGRIWRHFADFEVHVNGNLLEM